MQNLIRQIILFCIFFCLGFGVFYTSMRFNVPWYGNNDFIEYSKMVERPFNNDAISPFAYRVITPTIAHFVHKSGIYFKSKSSTPFHDKFTEHNGKIYKASILQSMMFTNFIFIVLACTVIASIIRKTISDFNNGMVTLLQVFIPLLLMLSLSSIRDGLAAINEGGGLLFITLMIYFFRSKNLIFFSIVTFVSIFQREIASLIFLVYIICFWDMKKNKYYILACLVAFATYLIIKISIYQIPGWEQQTNVFAMAHNFLKLDKDFIKHLLFGNNIFYALVFFAFLLGEKIKPMKLFAPYFLTITFIILLSAAQGIGNSVDRTINLALPILLITLIDVLRMQYLDVLATQNKLKLNSKIQ